MARQLPHLHGSRPGGASTTTQFAADPPAQRATTEGRTQLAPTTSRNPSPPCSARRGRVRTTRDARAPVRRHLRRHHLRVRRLEPASLLAIASKRLTVAGSSTENSIGGLQHDGRPMTRGYMPACFQRLPDPGRESEAAPVAIDDGHPHMVAGWIQAGDQPALEVHPRREATTSDCQPPSR